MEPAVVYDPAGHLTQAVLELRSSSVVPTGQTKDEQGPVDEAGTKRPAELQATHAVAGFLSSSVKPMAQAVHVVLPSPLNVPALQAVQGVAGLLSSSAVPAGQTYVLHTPMDPSAVYVPGEHFVQTPLRSTVPALQTSQTRSEVRVGALNS
jgi:hypothetical protein